MKFTYTTPAIQVLDLEIADILTLSVTDDPISFGDDDIKIVF